MAEEKGKEPDSAEVISRFKEFAEESDKRFNAEISEWRDMRDFASGDQMRNTFPASDKYAGRYKASANIIPRIVGAIVNSVRVDPYSIECVDKTGGKMDELSTAMGVWMKSLAERCPFSGFQGESLRSACSFGLGAFYAYTDIDETTGKSSVFVDVVDDPTMIVMDPSATDISGKDSEKIAFVDIVSKDRAKRLYGEDACEDWNKPLLSNFGASWSRQLESQVQVVTYFEREKDSVMMYRMVGDKVVRYVELPISRIPVYLVKGIVDWAGGQKVLHGVSQMTKDLQIIINYAQSQLAERMLRAPKPQFSISKEAMEGNEDYYKNVDKNMSPLLVYNAWNKDGKELPVPTRVDNSVYTDDVQKILEVERNLAADVTGVSRGLGMVQGQGDRETAEGLLLRTKSNEADVSNYREHLKSAVLELGKTLLELFCFENGIDLSEARQQVAVQVTKGPELVTSKQEARSQLLAISQIIPESMKPVIAFGVASTLDNPEVKGIGKMLYKLLPAEVLQDNPAVMQVQQQAQQQMQAMAQQMEQKDATINELQTQIAQLQLRAEADVEVANIAADARIKEASIKAGKDITVQNRKSQDDLKRDLVKAEIAEATRRAETGNDDYQQNVNI